MAERGWDRSSARHGTASSSRVILGTGLIMVLTLMYFPNGIVGTLGQRTSSRGS